MKYSRVLILLFSFNCFALTKFSLEVDFENRFFLDDSNPQTYSTNHSLSLNPDFKFKEGLFKMRLKGLARVDARDNSKNFIYPEDLWLSLDSGEHIFKLGYQTVNWSSTEAFHPSDVINSRNQDSNVRNPGKIGELMASYKFLFGNSSLFAYFSPLVRDPIFPSSTNQFGFGSQLNDPFYINNDNVLTDDKAIPQFGFKFNTQLSGVDLSFQYLSIVDRSQPIILPVCGIVGCTEFDLILPYVQQLGFTTQLPLSEFVLKSEFIYKIYDEKFINDDLFDQYIAPVFLTKRLVQNHGQLALGLERTSSFSTGSELTVLIEFQRMLGLNDTLIYDASLFQNDGFLGFRYALNNENSSEVFLSSIFDLDHFKQFIIQASYSQRFLDSWKLETGLQMVASEQIDDYLGVEAIDGSDHFYLSFKKYF